MANEFSPKVGSAVTKTDADAWIEKYDKEMRKDKDKDTKSIFYGREILEKLLAQEGCAGISFFPCLKYNDYAKKDMLQMVLIGTREDGSLILPVDGAGKDASTEGILADVGTICPPYCPTGTGDKP